MRSANSLSLLHACGLGLPILLGISSVCVSSSTGIKQQQYHVLYDDTPGGRPQDANEAINASGIYAWNLFVYLNRPSLPGPSGRGLPDPKKKIGDDGTTVWESWKLGSEVYLIDGSDPGP